ncbi:hypothetical protein RN04_01465 [Arthrobacter sp. W1]|nr:hypothetical protein RN04_01465 [Arthrobacter sp. W1]
MLEPEDELNALVNAVRDREPKVRQPRHASNSPIDSVRTRETSAQRFDSRVRLAVLPAADEES